MEKKYYRKLNKYKLHIYSLLLFLGFVILVSKLFHHVYLPRANAESESTLWKYQCVDTMKTSRDRARNWKETTDLHNSITKQVALIKELGANCIAIDTPYDSEFLPYLRSWVTAARSAQLSIWFRGNFSGWEGWFDYPHTLTSHELLTKTSSFIQNNSDLFEDGDIFTPAPEGENGGEFNQVEIDEYPAFRSFLTSEYTVSQSAFSKIGKKVEVNWLSMNGGLAKRMLDATTINSTGQTVTLDHYIKTAPEMSEYINYFYDTFGAKVVIGEFGAPIPDINGEMTESEQALFIDKLFLELYNQREKVTGVNYWVLYDSSTALINPDGTKRKAYETVKKYFKPLTISGSVTDEFNTPLADVTIQESTYNQKLITDKNGDFTLLIPHATTNLSFSKPEYIATNTSITTSSPSLSITLKKQSPTLWDKIRKIFIK